jgi:hypothetical protein
MSSFSHFLSLSPIGRWHYKDFSSRDLPEFEAQLGNNFLKNSTRKAIQGLGHTAVTHSPRRIQLCAKQTTFCAQGYLFAPDTRVQITERCLCILQSLVENIFIFIFGMNQKNEFKIFALPGRQPLKICATPP